ncbi:MAG: hypothetical protein GX573_08425 [Chloroflexi bacterium]|nr:hypothetical protein [Chloroflexota bacterium]
MKLFGWLLVALCVVLIAGAAGARWIGQRAQTAPAFPLPGEDRCWDGLCFSAMPPEEVLAALRVSPRVAPGSAAILEGLQPAGYNPAVAFRWAPGTNRSLPVLLYWATNGYHLMRDWRQDSNPPLLRAGDVLAALGPPDRVSLQADQVSLHYASRRLEVVIVPSSIVLDRARLLPGDGVIRLFVISTDSPPATERVYYPPSSPWQGFGLIQFATRP